MSRDAPQTSSDDAPVPARAGPRVLRVVVYFMLVTSAVASFLAGDSLWSAARSGDLPVWAPLLAPVAFTIFVLLFAVDRWLQVKRNHYSFGRAVLQLGLAVLFLSLLWPYHAGELRLARSAVRPADATRRLLNHRDADVRAAACELLELRGDPGAYDAVAAVATQDRSDAVRQRCELARLALERAGRDRE